MTLVRPLSNHVALVTGASRGIGRGIALQLGEAGAKVYVTGRPQKNSDGKQTPLEKVAAEITQRGGVGVPVFCDHSNPEKVKDLFEQIKKENNGQLDILVNNAYAGVDFVFENATKKFFDLDPVEPFDSANNVGLRNHYVCSVYAARLMIPRKQGLIVTISSLGGMGYLFDVAYGIGKAGCDKLASDMAVDLLNTGVVSVSLWPGAVKTEAVEEAFLKNENAMKRVFEKAETVEYSGKCIAALATDTEKEKYNGNILTTAIIGRHYNIFDEGNAQPAETPARYQKYLNTVNELRKPSDFMKNLEG
jgi:dehydrogenase/reductase SDR family protein 1